MRSPIDGHFSCFCALDFVSNAAMNMRVQISSQISVFIVVGYIPRNGVSRLCGSSLFYFLRKLLGVFHGSCTNLHSHNRAQGYSFLHILASICYSCVFDNRHSDRCEVITCCGFDLHFPDGLSCRAYFHVPLRRHTEDIYISSLENIYLDSLPRFCIKLSFVLLLSCINSLYILDIKFLLDIWFPNIFSHSICCLFILLMISFVVKIFSVNIVSFVCFCLHCLCFSHQIQKTIAKTHVKEFTTYILF